MWKRLRYRGEVLPYEVSTLGEVKRIAGKDCAGRTRPPTVLRQHNTGLGYLQVMICNNRKRRFLQAHALVAFTYLGDPPLPYGRGRGKIGINHKNGVKADNRLGNLEWASPKQNKAHASDNGFIARGENSARGKLNANQVLELRGLAEAGLTATELAKRYRISVTATCNIIKRRWWRHV